MEVSNYIKMRDQMQERFLTYDQKEIEGKYGFCLLYTSPSPRDCS